ncbi:MAG: glycoside hydrolase family 92 protein [Verrucomicrobia bacterium]|jgi:predicted alpha-1,2-mannosidase|nr:glycoside hydrolase family 92 protein [Verrucomicrobiota bacterium]
MNPVDHVNPLIGAVAYAEGSADAHGFGKTFPGTATPFGLVQLSPDTITGGDNSSGYSFVHDTLEGFSFAHLSGTGWYGDLGNFLVTPTVGALHTARGTPDDPDGGYRSRISHDTEVAQAGYYAITLDDYGVRAELTASPRAGMMRFTFPAHSQSRIQIDLARRIGGTSTEQYVRVVDEHTICGWMRCPPEGGGFGNGAGGVDYTLHFYCQFSKPLARHGVWRAEIPKDWARGNFDVSGEAYQRAVAEAQVVYGEREARGRHLGFFSEFATAEDEQVQLKCGISFVSIDGAKANLEHDIPHWDFDAVRAAARSAWERALSAVGVEGGSDDEKETFYTALYHSMIDPRCVSDVTGDYVGADGQVHRSTDFTYRSVFSGWDVYRSQFPLQTLINPSMVDDEINSLLQIAELGGRGYLPRWEMLNAYTGSMLGNPGVVVITDAYRKGIRNYDVDKAFDCCKQSVETFGNGELGYAAKGIGKGCISETLEYAYSDWCFARLAEALGKTELVADYDERSKAYRNIWNDEVHWFRARDEAGDWLEWKGKTVHGQGCRESNPYQQGWFVPHDIPGLVELMGEESFLEELTALFENTPADFLWNDYYNHPNEPVHNTVFLFNAIGKPWLTQKWSRRICAKAYGPGPFGLCGNEDVGQMSAWYVLAAMGIHPVCPGDGTYQITSPVFERIEIALDSEYHSGKTFTILARDNSAENIYIQAMTLNGEPLTRFWLSHEEITAGGILELKMGAAPRT